MCIRLFCSIGSPVNRDEAIVHLRCLSDQVAGKFCVGQAERDELDRETRDALRALGVTDADVEDAYK